jgi:hypothetical protein
MKDIKHEVELSIIRNTIIDYMYNKEELNNNDINLLLELGLNNPSKERIE